MSKKYELITKLYNKTLSDVFSNTQDWMAFLRSACYNYRLPFDDLLLIYAQRPDATAVLPINSWNRLFKRWVNGGSTGIAVFDHAYTQRIHLKYYFDISDTHESRFSPPVPLWTATPEDTADITETLENRFGTLADKSDLAQTLLSAAQNAVEDNHADYLAELLRIYEDTDLVWLDRSDVETTYKKLLQNSVGYLLLTRCGADANAHFSADSFKELPRFNTPEAMHCLGVAARDIAETLLMPIARTVRGRKQPEKKNRTFAENRPVRYAERNEEKQQPAERRNEHGTNVYDAGRVPSAEPDCAGAAGSNAWEVRVTAADVSEGASQSTLHDAADQRTADSAPRGDRAGGAAPDGADRDAAGESRERDGGSESPRPDEMGGPDEQLPAIGGGNHPGGTDLQLTLAEPDVDGGQTNDETPKTQISPLPSVAEQQKTIERAGAKNAPAFSMPESEPTQVSFDTVLENGGYDTDGQLSIMPLPKISQVVIDEALRGDEQDSDYRLTICSYFLNHGDLTDRVKCLRHYTKKGSSIRGRNDDVIYTSTGVTVINGSLTSYEEVNLKWSEAAKRIGQMITSNVFLSDADRTAIPAFERKQIARELRAFFLDAPQELPRPFNAKSDWNDSFLEIEQQLSDPEKLDAIYDMMRPVMESISEYDRLYRQRKSEMEHFIAYRDGTYSLFGEIKRPKKESERSEEPFEPDEETASAPVPTDTNADLEQAKEFINAYHMEEFDQEADFSDLHHVDLAYSTTTDSGHTIETFADLVSCNLVYAVDGKTVWESSCKSLSELNEYLAILDFDKMTEDAEDAFLQEQQEQEQEHERPAQTADLPAEEEQPQLRSVVIDLTPRDGQSSSKSLIGRRLTMDDRTFEVESVSDFSGDVSLRDVTFEKDVGFPITRIEKIGTVRRLLAQQAEKEVPPEKKSTLAPPAPRRKKAAPFALHPEIPAAQRSNYRITDDHFAEGGAKKKFQNNLAAIRALQQIEAENRLATPEEQEILARYVGWGGLAQAFDENNEAWAKEAAELRALLPDTEYRAARATTLNAHYTSPAVIKAIYKAIESTGFRSGNVLEPSCGIGNFFGLVPESMAGSKLYGVELDSVTGRIAQQLYQHNRIAVQGYESADLPDNFFDLAVGNVPFGGYSLHDRRYDKHHFLIHDYFFAKTLDKVRPGGIIAFVTSKGTMDKKDSSVRRYLAQRAELIGAIRLPNNAFLANAGTQVTTDILFLQKREKMIEADPEWLHLGKTESGVPINQYFLSHPEMVLGEMVFDKSMYGSKDETSCHPFENADLAELLDKAIQNIHAEYTPFEAAEIEAEEDEAIPADPSVRNFSYTDVGGTLYYRENSLMFPVKQSLTGKSRIRGMLAIRDSVRRLIACQAENATEQEITQEQKRLNRLYDDYTAKYGLLNSRANNTAFSADSSYPLLCALEILDENNNLDRKADMFSKRTIQPYVSVDRVDTASEALAVSIGEKACVDLRFMASLMDGAGGKDETIEHIKRDLAGVIFRDPDAGAADSLSGWQTADEYLSGRVKEKLARAKLAAAQDPAYAVNVTALERVQPKDLTAGEISVRLGTTWIPTEIIDQFIYTLLGTPYSLQAHIKVSYSKVSGEWYISDKSRDRSNVRAYNTYGTKCINAYKIIEQSLNLRDVRIFDTIQTEKGERRVLNKKETAIAQDKQDAIRQKFKDWVWQDPKRREYLCRFYNDRFNSVRPREYDGQHIKFVGMNPEITLRPHQRNAIARALYGGNALFGHAVGAGKSYEMIATAMEAKRLGLSSKSMFVVPNNIIGDFASDFLKLYPSANILVTTKKDFEKQNRKKFCARIATGDYDGVIIGHSQFEKIPLSPERQIAMLERQINELIQGIADMKAEEGAQFSIKQMEKSRKNLEAKLKKLVESKEKDDTVTFEELGVDRLFVDEADMFKNLFLYTKMRNVGGISQTEAQKSSDLFMKCQYLDELTGEKGVVFATGTPLSNSMVELYTMQRYLQYSTLERMELLHFDAWAAQFGETVTSMELKPEGSGYQQKTRFSNFYNLPELMAMFKEIADIQTADMLNLPVPKANFRTVVCEASEIQKEMVEALGERAEQVRSGMVDANKDNMLLITNDGRKLALDQRLMNPMLPDFEGSKVNICANNIYQIWEKTSEKRLTQLVFCDLSTPGNRVPIRMEENAAGVFEMGEFQNVYDDLRNKLIAKGIPADEIAFVHSANNETQKKELFAKVRKGTIRVLLGSTFKMGAGTNCQDRLVALHDLDCRATRS